jgi:hypothetical protein
MANLWQFPFFLTRFLASRTLVTAVIGASNRVLQTLAALTHGQVLGQSGR